MIGNNVNGARLGSLRHSYLLDSSVYAEFVSSVPALFPSASGTEICPELSCVKSTTVITFYISLVTSPLLLLLFVPVSTHSFWQ